MKTAKPRRAFTLVELLVVIGIIALLISILLPALRRAQEQAKRVLCMSNHKQMGTALHLYATDNKNGVPHPNWLGQESSTRSPGWLYDANHGTPQTRRSETGALFKYLRNPRIYRCPFDPEPWNIGDVHPITSYGMNGAVGAFGDPIPWFKINQFKGNAIVIWELNEYHHVKYGGANIFNDAANFPAEGLSMRHGSWQNPKSAGGIVTTFAGTVEWMTMADYDNDWRRSKTMNTPGRLYCIPTKYASNGGANRGPTIPPLW